MTAGLATPLALDSKLSSQLAIYLWSNLQALSATRLTKTLDNESQRLDFTRVRTDTSIR
jgi:hypothetical protein